jgi:hypothetical protein
VVVVIAIIEVVDHQLHHVLEVVYTVLPVAKI